MNTADLNTTSTPEVHYEALFDSAADYIFVIDYDGLILRANRHVFEKSGYGKDELIGRSIRDFFTEKSKAICDCNFPKLRSRGYNRANIEFVCKDGQVIQMECMATGVPDADGKFTSFFIIQRDVTEQDCAARALANSERRFRTIFNSTYQFIGLLNRDGILLEANQTVLDFLGCTEDQIVGKPFWEIMWRNIPVDDQERIKAAVEKTARGELVRYQIEMAGKSNEVKTVDFSLKPVFNEKGETVLIIPEGRDITELKLAGEEIHRHQREAAHAMRLSTMGEMASGMAHELNQPLTALAGYCGAAKLLVNSGTPELQELNEMLERTMEQALRAGEIIRHLREFVSKGDDCRENVRVDHLVEDTIAFLRWEFRNEKVALKYRPGCNSGEIFANRVQVEQVLVNLLRNSLEAIQNSDTREGKVTVQTGLTSGDSVEVTVTDNGPGIDATIENRMFTPFQSSKVSGMGMGLSISRSIIELHDGRMWGSNIPHGGAIFGFSLPLTQH